MLRRFVKTRHLFENCRPIDFVIWARHSGIALPADVIEAVERNAPELIDWRESYSRLALKADHLVEYFKSVQREHEVTSKRHEDRLDQARSYNCSLLNYVDNLEKGSAADREIILELFELVDELKYRLDATETSLKSRETPLGERERSTFEKIILAAAVGGFGYVMSAARSPVPGEIAAEADKLGTPVSAETIAKKLREAVVKHAPNDPLTPGR